MMKTGLKKVTTVLLAASLSGGAFMSIPNLSTATVAHAAAKIPYSQLQSDVSALKAALGKASTVVQGEMADSLSFDRDGAYTNSGVGTIGTYLEGLGQSMFDAGIHDDNNFRADLASLIATYQVFKSRLSSGSQTQLESLAKGNENDIDTYESDKSENWAMVDDLAQAQKGFANALANAVVEDYGSKYDDVVAAKPKTVSAKSVISKLVVKKTASKKYVKITGRVKLYRSANYARIKTYKGYKYAKLSGNHSFNKVVYAPKAKSVRISVGQYSHGHFSAVTAAKTAKVK